MGYLLKKKLLSSWDKPAFDLFIRSGLRMRCLFDTGADMPVFTLGNDALCKYFPDAQLQKELTYILSGFGKGSEEASCFRPAIAYPFILSATMFSHMNYTIINEGKEAKCLEVQHSKPVYNIGIVSSKLDNTKLAKIYSFVENGCDK